MSPVITSYPEAAAAVTGGYGAGFPVAAVVALVGAVLILRIRSAR